MLESIYLTTFEYIDQPNDMILLTDSEIKEVFVDRISFIGSVDDIIVNETDVNYSQLRMDNGVSLIVDSDNLDVLHGYISILKGVKQ